MPSIEHPLAQGQLNRNPARFITRMSWNKQRDNPMKTYTNLISVILE